MGIVSFGAQKLNIAEVPDGHAIISEADLQRFRSAENNYLSLKAYIPVEHLGNLPKVQELLEKGSRYDTLNQEKSTISMQLSEANTKLQAVKNLPEGYTQEKWNTYESRAKSEVRNQQMTELLKKTEDYAGEKFKIKIPKIDPRFLSQEKLNKIDPTAADAPQKYLDILNEGHTAQQEFLKTFGNDVTLEQSQRAPSQQFDIQAPQSGLKDVASETGVHIQHM